MTRAQCVAMVVPAWPPGAVPNGIITYASHIAPAFRDCGARPVILTWQLDASAQGAAVLEAPGDVVDLSAFEPGRTMMGRTWAKASRLLGGHAVGDARDTMIARGVRSALSRFPIGLVEIEESFGLAGRIADIGVVPVVTRLHGPWFLNGEAVGAKRNKEFARRVNQERESIERADGVTAPSSDVLERTRAFYDLPLAQARVIPCPVAQSDWNHPWSLAECDRTRLTFIGRFDLHKGADVMIDAFARLAEAWPDLQLDFIGPDRGIPDSSGRLIPFAEYVGRTVLDPAIRRRIVFYGPKSAIDVNAYRRRGMLTIVPSRYETFGYTAVEAMGLGCPLVAAAAGGLAEIVRDNETGLLFRGSDPQLLARRIETLLKAPEFAAGLGAAARADVGRRYCPRSIAEETLDFYAQVIDRFAAKLDFSATDAEGLAEKRRAARARQRPNA